MHLTDEQLNEYLDHETRDPLSIEVHLSSCADCAGRLAALQSLFAEIESLPELEFSTPIADRVSTRPSLPRSLTLTAILQVALAVVAIVVAAPMVMDATGTFARGLSVPSLVDIWLVLQTQWMVVLDALSTLSLPSIPAIPLIDMSGWIMLLAVFGASLLWLIGNGLLLRNQIR